MDNIIFDSDQEKALDVMYKKYKQGQKEIVLSGISGSGKSTIIKTLTEDMLGLKDPYYGAYTGRAAKVLRIKGLPAITLHKLLYKLKIMPNKKMVFVLRGLEEFEDIEVIIIDEISMVPQSMIDDIRKVGIRIIAMGDPFQLDSIGKPNQLLKTPDAQLVNPHRQSLENPIYYWANEIRTKGKMPTIGMHGSEMLVVGSYSSLDDRLKMNAEVTLCGTNRTRVDINKNIRRLNNIESKLAKDDIIVFLKNNWDSLSTIESPIVNGGRGKILSIGEAINYDFKDFNFITKRIDRFVFNALPVKVECIEEGGCWDTLLLESAFGTSKFDGFMSFSEDGPNLNYADYGHCITTHKSQGSEWIKGIYINETFGDEPLRQTYTGLTRFKEKAIFCFRP